MKPTPLELVAMEASIEGQITAMAARASNMLRIKSEIREHRKNGTLTPEMVEVESQILAEAEHLSELADQIRKFDPTDQPDTH